MLEMFEVIIKMTLLLGLFGIAWFDYRTKLIDARWLWIVGVAGLVLLFSQNGVMAVRQIFAGVVPGALLLLLRITHAVRVLNRGNRMSALFRTSH